MLSGSDMNRILKIVLAVALAMLCQSAHAASENDTTTPAVQLLDSHKSTTTLEGMMLRIAKPILRKTPMVALMDDIEMMMICPVGKISKKDNGEFARKAATVFKGYMLAHEINDELSHMLIYVNGLKDNRFEELVLYITSPDPNILLFRGNFTVEGLMTVGKLSEQDRKKRIKTKRETGRDDSYIQNLK